MSESISIGRSLSAIAAIPITAIRIGEVRSDTECFVEYALRLRAPRLLGRATMSREVLVERCADDLRQCTSVVCAQLLDAIALLLGQVDLGTGCSSHIQRSIQHARTTVGRPDADTLLARTLGAVELGERRDLVGLAGDSAEGDHLQAVGT